MSFPPVIKEVLINRQAGVGWGARGRVRIVILRVCVCEGVQDVSDHEQYAFQVSICISRGVRDSGNEVNSITKYPRGITDIQQRLGCIRLLFEFLFERGEVMHFPP